MQSNQLVKSTDEPTVGVGSASLLYGISLAIHRAWIPAFEPRTWSCTILEHTQRTSPRNSVTQTGNSPQHGYTNRANPVCPLSGDTHAVASFVAG